MRQVWITKAGPPEVLQVREAPDPTPGPGQVRIRVRAAGINFADLSARMGIYPDAPPIPCVVGYEVSGVVDAAGSGVTGIAEGQRVFGMPRFGGYTDTLLIPAAQVYPLPERMTFEEAAALPVNYLTAHHMMLYTGNTHEGSRVLIHSAAGGVGHAAIQLAKMRNCVIYGTASASKHDYLRALGVHHPIDSQGDVYAQLRQALGDERLDLVLDPVGGDSWSQGYRLLGPAGRLVVFGFSGASTGTTRNLAMVAWQFLSSRRFTPFDLMDKNRTVTGTNMGHLFDSLGILDPQFRALLRLYEEGHIRPHVDKVFSFDDAAAAHQYLHDRKAKGKVLLAPSAPAAG